MHLAFLTPEYPHPLSTPYGGLGTSIKSLVENLISPSVKVTVFVYGQKQDRIFEEGGISFHFIKQQKYFFLGWWFYRKYLERYLNKEIEKNQIDALEAPDWTGITAFIKLKCQLAVRLHGSDGYFCKLENRSQKKKNFWFENAALKGADKLISVSKFTAQTTADIFGIRREIEVIPNSVNVKNFVPSVKKGKPGRILYFGSIIRKKGVLELPAIFYFVSQKNSEATLIMAGRDVVDVQTGKSTREIFQEKLKAEVANRVLWLGNLPQDEIQCEISKATVVVLPSFAEALPMTWLEAMAMEKALVTSNIGWAKEVMINGKTGFTVYPKDHELYAEKVLELLNDPDLTAKMGKAARNQIIANFSSELIIKNNLHFYRSITNKTL